MKTCTKCGDTKALDEFSKKHGAKDGHRSYCKVCAIKIQRAYREADKVKAAARANAYYEANKERNRARDKAYRKANKERINARGKAWREANKERVNARIKAWAKSNNGLRKATWARRRAAKLQAIPAWANPDAIKGFYETALPGEHVDHIVPLQGKTVSGLHCEANLQHLPASENQSKSNKYWPDMWE